MSVKEWKLLKNRIEELERQQDQAIKLLETMLRYSEYGTTPTEDDNAVIDTCAFLVTLNR